jgi:stalled ribosome alternative rescue factor ArfA
VASKIPKRRKPKKSNVYAAALKLFKAKIVKPRKGTKAYNRKKAIKTIHEVETER